MIARPAKSLAWFRGRSGAHLTPHAEGVELVDDAGNTRGMVVFDLWTPGAAHCHWEIDTDAAAAAFRTLLPVAANLLFRTAGKRVAVGLIPANCERSVRLARHFGFREAHRIRDGWAAGVDLCVMEMRAADCRWLEERKAA